MTKILLTILALSLATVEISSQGSTPQLTKNNIGQEASFKLRQPLLEEEVSKSLLPVVDIDKMTLN